MKARTWVGLNSKVSLIYLRDIYAMQCFTDKQCTRVRLPLRFGGEEMGPPSPVGVLLGPRRVVLWTRPPLPLVQRRTHLGTHSLLYVSGSGVWGVAGVALGLA